LQYLAFSSQSKTRTASQKLIMQHYHQFLYLQDAPTGHTPLQPSSPSSRQRTCGTWNSMGMSPPCSVRWLGYATLVPDRSITANTCPGTSVQAFVRKWASISSPSRKSRYRAFISLNLGLFQAHVSMTGGSWVPLYVKHNHTGIRGCALGCIWFDAHLESSLRRNFSFPCTSVLKNIRVTVSRIHEILSGKRATLPTYQQRRGSAGRQHILCLQSSYS